FARMIGYGLSPLDGEIKSVIPEEKLKDDGNQLEFVIRTCKKGDLRARYQIAIFDPVRDHHEEPYQKFPCLQHFTFTPDHSAKSLSVNAFYASQQLYVKAYGNWLGLCRLGKFMAGHLNLEFKSLNCFVGIQNMNPKPKSSESLGRINQAIEYSLNISNETTS
ncbi:MAG: hypothetical protein P1V20_04975, partial [Verrucomicrobiales bacterium]|nr:hypothetical protein [Verrucomicrobiales bacterium]